MATDFRFVPQPPDPISGVEVLKQVERAINELGSQIENGGGDCSEAITIASNAQATANNAVGIAIDAQSHAQNALAGLDSLEPRITTVEGVADTALDQGNKALNAANVAQSIASNAATSASAAQGAAGEAQSAASNAETIAASAQDIAGEALTIATNTGVYVVNGDSGYDADAIFGNAVKVYVAGATPLNFPLGLTEPIWFDVHITDDRQNVIQICRNNTSSLVYTRSGSVNSSDAQNPIVTWGPWNTVAVPEFIVSVSVVINPSGQPAGTYLAIVSTTTSGNVTSYINLSQIIGAGYSPGNGAISISVDNKISLQLDPVASTGLTVAPSGLQTLAASAASISLDGLPGIARYARIGDKASIDKAATPAGVASQIVDALEELESSGGGVIPLAGASTATEDGTPGKAVYAADSDTASHDKAATPAGVAAQIAMIPTSSGPVLMPWNEFKNLWDAGQLAAGAYHVTGSPYDDPSDPG